MLFEGTSKRSFANLKKALDILRILALFQICKIPFVGTPIGNEKCSNFSHPGTHTRICTALAGKILDSSHAP
jgi:hypothetical protein